MDTGNKIHNSGYNFHHPRPSCHNFRLSPNDATPNLLCKNTSFEEEEGSDLMGIDLSAIVSALAKQQAEMVEEEWDARKPKGGDDDSSCSDESSSNERSKYHISKDLHDLSKMFIQTTMLPRPKSEGNFKGQQIEHGKDEGNGDEAEDVTKEGNTQREDDNRKQCHEDKVDNEHQHHHVPLSLSFHPLKSLQKTFHKSDTLYPSTYSSVAYGSSNTPPMSGTIAPVSSPRLPYNHRHHGHFHHHSPPTFLTLSSRTGMHGRDNTTSHSSRSSPTHKHKSKAGKKDPSIGTNLNITSGHSKDNTPSYGAIPQIAAPTPPGGLPIYITPLLSPNEPISEPTQTVEQVDKRTKYAKIRPKSSGNMK